MDSLDVRQSLPPSKLLGSNCQCMSEVPVVLNMSQEQQFKGAIPDGLAKALSRYTDMVGALIGEQFDRLTAAYDKVRLRFRECALPECLQV